MLANLKEWYDENAGAKDDAFVLNRLTPDASYYILRSVSLDMRGSTMLKRCLSLLSAPFAGID